jgi:hypothetical protein
MVPINVVFKKVPGKSRRETDAKNGNVIYPAASEFDCFPTRFIPRS